MRLFVSFRGRKILIDVKKTGFISRGTGLTFRTRNAKNLLFDFSKLVTWQGNITSWFVFFPFLILWLDKNNKVIDFKVVEPFTFCIKQKKKFYKIVEIPFNNKNKEIIVRFIGNQKFLKHFRRKKRY